MPHKITTAPRSSSTSIFKAKANEVNTASLRLLIAIINLLKMLTNQATVSNVKDNTPALNDVNFLKGYEGESYL